MAKKLSETLLIDEENLKLWSPISKNVSVDKIFPFVTLAQQYYLVEVLGTPLTQELQQQIVDNQLTNANKALLIKIFPVIGFWTSYLALRSLSYSTNQKGVIKEKSENSEALNHTELGEYLLSLKEQAEQFTELLIKYLCNCQELYPLWRPSRECNCDKYLPTDGSNERTYHNPVFFPNKTGGCGCGCDDTHWISKR